MVIGYVQVEQLAFLMPYTTNLEELMKRFSLTTLVALLMLAFASTAVAAPAYSGMQPKVSSFDFLVDYSGSMMMTHKTLGELKFNIAQDVLKRVNDRIPELGYTGSVHTFATDKEVLAQTTFAAPAFADAYTSLKMTYEVYDRLTPMGNGIQHWSNALYAGLAQPTAVIIVSDGENNRGIDPVAAAQAAMAANPGLCFHVISLADTAEGQQTLDSIAALRHDCSVSVKAAELLASDAAVEQFVRDVFYTGEGKIVLRSVQFALASAVINHESAAILDEVSAIIKKSGRSIQVDGHTCSLGSDQYNMGLSQRRAASVKAYLVKKGVSASAITTAGYGESQPKFDNSTDQGRRLNRRAEIDFR